MNHFDSVHVADAGAIGLAVATLAGYLPSIAAGLSIVWMCIRIYETKTVQRWLYGNIEGADDNGDDE